MHRIGIFGAPCVIGVAVALALLSLVSASGHASLTKAQKTVNWIKGYKCPEIGRVPAVRGLESTLETQAARAKYAKFARDSLPALNQAYKQRAAIMQDIRARGNNPGRKLRAALQRLDADIDARIANVGVALTYWTLANWVEMAKMDASFSPGGRHPLGKFVARGNELDQLARPFRNTPVYKELIAPIPAKYRTCLYAMQNQVAEHNSDAFLSAARNASDLQTIPRLIDDLSVLNGFRGGGQSEPKLVTELNLIQRELKEPMLRAQREREARERAAANAKREREDAKRRQRLEGQLVVARAIVSSMKSKNVDGVVRHLTNDVIYAPPKGAMVMGKKYVRSHFQKAFSKPQANQPSLSPPTIRGDRIAASMTARSNRGTAHGAMTFDFSGQKVKRISIRFNR